MHVHTVPEKNRGSPVLSDGPKNVEIEAMYLSICHCSWHSHRKIFEKIGESPVLYEGKNVEIETIQLFISLKKLARVQSCMKATKVIKLKQCSHTEHLSPHNSFPTPLTSHLTPDNSHHTPQPLTSYLTPHTPQPLTSYLKHGSAEWRKPLDNHYYFLVVLVIYQ